MDEKDNAFFLDNIIYYNLQTKDKKPQTAEDMKKCLQLRAKTIRGR